MTKNTLEDIIGKMFKERKEFQEKVFLQNNHEAIGNFLLIVLKAVEGLKRGVDIPSFETIYDEEYEGVKFTIKEKPYFKIPNFIERLRYILHNYGKLLQLNQTIQELSELIKAITKNEGNRREQILEELADVYIMLGQLKLIFEFDEEIVGKKIDEKLTRTIEKIEKEKENK